MNITVSKDETVRFIGLKIQATETVTRIYEGYSGRNREVVFHPDRVSIKISTSVTTVDISGPIVLKSGAISEHRRENRYWYGWDSFKNTAPEWLIQVVNDAIVGDL